MMHLLLFAGTSDGRMLAERLRDLPVRATLCVATEYGGKTLDDLSGRFAVKVGRMDAETMRFLIAETGCRFVIDATHPYAAEASANIRAAAGAEGVCRLRLSRRESPRGDRMHVNSAADAAAMLAATSGNILLTTGAKELAAYTAVPEYADRMYPRVLPTEESIRECARLGFKRGHIIAMQGPFSRELNLALIRQFGIAVMVTKDGGAEGGFPEKMFAAGDAGVRVLVIGRPGGEKGFSSDEILAMIRKELEAEA